MGVLEDRVMHGCFQSYFLFNVACMSSHVASYNFQPFLHCTMSRHNLHEHLDYQFE